MGRDSRHFLPRFVFGVRGFTGAGACGRYLGLFSLSVMQFHALALIWAVPPDFCGNREWGTPMFPQYRRYSMAGLLLATAAGVLLACGGDSVAGPGLAERAQDEGPVKLNYECGNTFRIRNSTYDSVTVIWEAEGTAERDTVVLPPRPAGEGFSARLITTAAAATVRLLDLDGKLIVSKQNEGGPACGGDGIGLQPPDSVPAWVYADSNLSSRTEFVSGEFYKGVLMVRFHSGASLADRESAIASVNGEVIGGWPMVGTEGRYLIRVPDPGTGENLVEAESLLNSLPQVAVASLEVLIYPLYRRPADGAGWTEWRLRSDPGTGELLVEAEAILNSLPPCGGRGARATSRAWLGALRGTLPC